MQVKFAPKQRIPKFNEEISIEYSGLHLPLATVTGACHGYHIWLDTSSLPFGAIFQKCSTSKRIVLHNDGDIGASFKWDIERMRPDFSILPVMGYLSPGMEVCCDVTFSPSNVATDIRRENVSCFIEGTSPLKLTLSGSCVQVTPQKETQSFETNVRQVEKKQISLFNRTNTAWEIKPIIDGDFFTGLDSFQVEPQASYSYELTYAPITMTLDGKKHSGSLFFPLPDGTGIFYNLLGTANPPKPSGKRQFECLCKTTFADVLVVENWLKKPQRFKVTFEIVRSDRSGTDVSGTGIKGHEYVDVPGNGKKEYKFTFYAHKEGTTLLKAIFKNEQSGEYCYYELGFKAGKAPSLGTIDLLTQVRVPVSYTLKLDNPLQNIVTFNATCTNATEVLIPPSISITGKGHVIILFFCSFELFFFLFKLINQKINQL